MDAVVGYPDAHHATEAIMLKGIGFGLALTMMLVASCSSSDSGDSSITFSCDNAKSKCENDPPLPADECKKAIGDPKCGSVFMAFFLCIGEHQVCLPDGTTDTGAWGRACAMQQNAVAQCGGVPDGGGGD